MLKMTGAAAGGAALGIGAYAGGEKLYRFGHERRRAAAATSRAATGTSTDPARDK